MTDRGRSDARCAAEALKHAGVEELYSSDLDRAVETAGIVGETLGLTPRLRKNLREISLGPWEGRALSEVEADDGEALWRWRFDGRRPPYDGIEPIAVFRDRLFGELDSIVAGAARRVAVVSHGGTISVILTRIVGLGLLRIWQMPTENGSLSRVFHDGERYFLSSFNETGHLAPRTAPGMNSLG